MRFSVDQKDFARAIKAAMGPITRSTVPILECVRIKAKDNALSVHGTNMDVHVFAKCEAAVAEDGEAHVNVRDLHALVSRMRDTIEVESGLSVRDKTASGRLVELTDAFPNAKKPENEVEVIGGVEAVLECVDYAAKEEAKPQFRGVFINDGFAMATSGAALRAYPVSQDCQGVIPVQAAATLKSVGGRLFLSEATWRCEAEGVSATGRNLDAAFVNWRAIVPAHYPLLSLDAEILLSSIELATAARGNVCVFTVKSGELTIHGEAFGVQHMEASVKMVVDAPDMAFAVNTAQITKVAKSFQGRRLGISAAPSGALRFDAGADDVCCLQMLNDTRTNIPDQSVAA